MKIPLSWLREFVPFRFDASALADRLTQAGFEVEAVLEIEGEKVLDLNVPPNRGDCLSLLGVAREVAALIGQPLRKRPSRKLSGKGKIQSEAKVRWLDKKGAPRYSLQIIRNLKGGQSPEWMQKRLIQSGLRPINFIVDVTNYVLLERGQPLHAFDLGKLEKRARGEGVVLSIRRAKDKEVLKTLDGSSRSLTTEELLIADEVGVIALAGIMGGEETAVDLQTTAIVLESAFFDPLLIRRTSKRLGLTTESSYRFERGIDPSAVVDSLHRAVELLQNAGGIPTEDWVDHARQPVQTKISFQAAEVGDLMGGEWSRAEVEKGFGRLGLRKKGRNWEIPFYRWDLKEGIDLVEEAVRLKGLNRIPETIPTVESSSWRSPEAICRRRGQELTRAVRRQLVHLGFFEAIHSSFLSAEELREESEWLSQAVPLANPLGLETSFLRPTLIPSLLKTVANHHQHKIFNLRLFELRKIFIQSDSGPSERLSLGVVASGEPLFSHWSQKQREISFFDLKGVLEAVVSPGREPLRLEPGERSFLRPGQSAEVCLGGERIGWFGALHPSLADRLDLKKMVYLFEVDWEKILINRTGAAFFKQYSRFPLVERDLAVLVDEAIPAGRLRDFLAAQGSVIREVKVFDLYQGDQIPSGKKSLAFSLLLGREDKTLTDEEVNEALGRIVESVRREFHADIR